MISRNFLIGTLMLVIAGIFLSGCAEFLEDYQYNPAGPLYSSSSDN